MTETKLLPNVHPGEVLLEEFMKPLGLTAYRVAKSLGVGQTRIEGILDGKRAVTPDTAIRLAKYFGTSPQFWLNLQSRYDLEEAQRANSASYEGIEALPKPIVPA